MGAGSRWTAPGLRQPAVCEAVSSASSVGQQLNAVADAVVPSSEVRTNRGRPKRSDNVGSSVTPSSLVTRVREDGRPQRHAPWRVTNVNHLGNINLRSLQSNVDVYDDSKTELEGMAGDDNVYSQSSDEDEKYLSQEEKLDGVDNDSNLVMQQNGVYGLSSDNVQPPAVVPDVSEITPNLAYLAAQEVEDVDEDDVYHPIWNEAKVAEIMSHVIEHGTWEVVPLPAGRKAITSRWVTKRKTVPVPRLEDVTLRGFLQRPGIDYGETYAPVAKLVTVRVFLSLIAILGLSSWQLDIKTAFLNAPLEEEVYSKPTKDMIPLLELM